MNTFKRLIVAGFMNFRHHRENTSTNYLVYFRGATTKIYILTLFSINHQRFAQGYTVNKDMVG